MGNGLLLLRTLLLSTSRRNQRRHTTDSQKKKRLVGGAVGAAVLCLMLTAYCAAMCVGYGMVGLIDAVPATCALTISALAFLFTFFQTNGYLFGFKEYDMLLSLPLKTGTVAACRFLYMYVKNLPWYLVISLSMLLGYGYFARPAVSACFLWIVLSFFLPMIPMLGAAFLGYLIARLSTGFKKTNLVQTVLTFALILGSFFLRFFLEDMFRNERVEETLQMVSAATATAAAAYAPALWFSDAVTKGNVPGALLLMAVSAALFLLVFAVVGRSYRSINSALRTHAAARDFKMTAQRKRSVVNAIAFKEFRRLTGSTVYMTNGALGVVLAALVGIITLFLGAERIVATVTGGAPIDPALLRPAIPFIVYFFIGMMATTACTPSLEGKNYWIPQSLPLERKTLYQGKMLFNLYLTVPFMAFSTLCLCLSARVPMLETALYLLLGLSLCAFSTAWGCVCGIRHMRLDWENEVEVIKRGAAVSLYLLPNMFVTMALTVGSAVTCMRVDPRCLTLGMILVTAVLAALSYRRALSLAEKAET